LKEFIINARTIVVDGSAKGEMLDKVFAHSADNALPFFKEYYDAFDPYDLAKKYTTEVHIINTYQLSNNTWQLTWDETKRDAKTGHKLNTQRMVATIT